MVVPAFAFCAWAELCLHLHEAPRILTDADLAEWIPLGDHSPVRRDEALSEYRGRPKDWISTCRVCPLLHLT